jgi:hypothetical protein
VEDHVGGHALLLCGGPAPAAQLLEDRLLLGRQVGGRQLRRPGSGPAAAGAAGPRRTRRPRGRRVLPEHDLPLPAQDLPARLRDPERLVLALHGEQALREKLTDDAAPGRVVQLGSDAERLQLMVRVL